jgi:TM2 domain-containing membrane protein YozV
MGASVSQINYWLDTTSSKSTKDNTPAGGDKAIYLSYNVFLCLSVLGGFFGLDHLYLRSPLTSIAKFIVNVFTFGTWWLYDATQAIFNRDVVKIFGLGVPGLGPKGIAAGVLANDVPDKKHMAFFVYAMALFMGGIFGLDSFITGNKLMGFIRVMCLITFIFIPVALFLWLYKIAMFLFKTNDVIEENSEYFGAPYTGFTVSGAFSFINALLDPLLAPLYAFKDAILGTATTAVCTAKKVADTAVSTAKTVVKEAAAVADVGKQLVQVPQTFQFNPSIAQQALGQIQTGQTAPGIAKALPISGPIPQAVAIPGSITESIPLGPLMPSQKGIPITGGGIINDNSILPYMVIGTFGLIAVSGLILTYRRFRQNGKQHKTDEPPTPSEPGVLRESNKKESPKAT